jgi:hypothetical protein
MTVSLFLDLKSLVSSLRHGSPLSEVSGRLRLIIEDGTNLLLNFGSPLVVELQSLEVFFDL